MEKVSCVRDGSQETASLADGIHGIVDSERGTVASMSYDARQRVLQLASAFLILFVMFTGCAPGTGAAEQLARPLTKAEIIELLSGYVSPAIVTDIVKGRGVGFELDQKTERELRAAGATDELLKAIREHYVSRVQQGPPVLSISTTPGDARVYVDDKQVGITSSKGKLELTDLSPGVHWLRISHDGYRDYEEPLTLDAGEKAQLNVKLESSSTVSSPEDSPTTAAKATHE